MIDSYSKLRSKFLNIKFKYFCVIIIFIKNSKCFMLTKNLVYLNLSPAEPFSAYKLVWKKLHPLQKKVTLQKNHSHNINLYNFYLNMINLF